MIVKTILNLINLMQFATEYHQNHPTSVASWAPPQWVRPLGESLSSGAELCKRVDVCGVLQGLLGT